MNSGPAALGGARFFQFAGRFAFRVRLLPGKTFAPNFKIEFFAECIHAGNADAVQSTRNFICGRIKFSAGVQSCHHNLRGRNFLAIDIHGIHRNSTAVVDHSHRVIEMHRDFNLVGVPGERFIDGVIDNFIHQMMQSKLTRRANVHRGAFADRFHAAEHFDRVGVVNRYSQSMMVCRSFLRRQFSRRPLPD